MNKAFTLIEVLIIVLIISFFTGFSIASYNSFTQQQKLKKEAIRLKSVIELARKKAISSDIYDPSCSNYQGYKVRINSNFYDLIFICDNPKTLQTYNLEKNINIILGTGEIIFPILGRNIKINIYTIRFKNNINNNCIDLFLDTLGNVDIGKPSSCYRERIPVEPSIGPTLNLYY
ncbi:MAG: hypothetical protein ACPLRN_03135 [Microgenomates group bacterium]